MLPLLSVSFVIERRDTDEVIVKYVRMIIDYEYADNLRGDLLDSTKENLNES
jgi:hypothetical protein